MDLPTHPEAHEHGAAPPKPPSSWAVRITIAVVVGLVAVVVVLHLTGVVGPAGN